MITVSLQEKRGTMPTLEKAVLGGGCFWCIEAVYNRVIGVHSALSGYSGGTRSNPSYEQVCTGLSGHAEVVEIMFDPSVIRYEDLLMVFWEIHNPTTLNVQGADKGTQYRSVIYYTTETQKEQALASISQAQKSFSNPIVTELSPLSEFFAAETYHQNYYSEHSTQGYCTAVIAPKLEKFMKNFGDKVKK